MLMMKQPSLSTRAGRCYRRTRIRGGRKQVRTWCVRQTHLARKKSWQFSLVKKIWKWKSFHPLSPCCRLLLCSRGYSALAHARAHVMNLIKKNGGGYLPNGKFPNTLFVTEIWKLTLWNGYCWLWFLYKAHWTQLCTAKFCNLGDIVVNLRLSVWLRRWHVWEEDLDSQDELAWLISRAIHASIVGPMLMTWHAHAHVRAHHAHVRAHHTHVRAHHVHLITHIHVTAFHDTPFHKAEVCQGFYLNRITSSSIANSP